jgi:hypothetical protein
LKIFEWLRGPQQPEEEASGISRRDFFARVAGRDQEGGQSSTAPPPDPRVLHTFFVAAFPFHDGPVLVPILRVGEEFKLAPEPAYSPDPTAVRIERGRDHLGYVPADLTEDVLTRLKAGEDLVCRAKLVDPAAELPRVLSVEIVLLPPESDPEAKEPLQTESPPE